jgi:hypothetical protein
MNRTLQLHALVDLSPFLSDGELVALNVGPDSQLYAVIAQKPLDYREIAASGAGFTKTIPSHPQTYRVLAFFVSDVTLDVQIKDERFNIHDVQPLPGGELLLVCCRSHYRAPADFDSNGRVYGPDGKLTRELLLGDGIAAVQTTASGLIWTSFFDEGVFGNYGWSQPVGAAGLVAWSPGGERVYEFSPGGGLDSIDDCYALNVESDSRTWLYYYSGFPLVLLQDRRIEAHWDVPISGSRAFAASASSALFSGGYKEKDTCDLFELEPGRVRAAGDFRLVDETGDKLVPERVIGRGGALHFLRAGRVYRLDLAKICR